MCWRINVSLSLFPKYAQSKIAMEDLAVYKIVKTTESQNQFLSFYHLSPYDTNTLYKGVRLPEDVFTRGWIEEGLHSYDGKCRINIHRGSSGNIYYIRVCGLCYKELDMYANEFGESPLAIIKCIIPESTRYYINEEGEIVSENLIIGTDYIKADNIIKGFPYDGMYLERLFNKPNNK